jgi:CBS domain-containing protein
MSAGNCKKEFDPPHIFALSWKARSGPAFLFSWPHAEALDLQRRARQERTVTIFSFAYAEAIGMQLRDILGVKGRTVHTCSPDDTLSDVVDLLVGHNIGSLVVCQDGQMVGIITERDILRASAATRGPLGSVTVRDRMTRCPIVAALHDELTDVMGVLTEQRIRHLPVVERGELVGIISIGDLVKAQHDELSRENHYLKSYIQS